MAATPRKKPATAKKAAAAEKPAAAVKKTVPPKPPAAKKAAIATRKPTVDASRPIGDGPAWDGDPDKIPDYKADTDIVSAVISQFRLIRGVRGKIRAAGVILLRMLP